MAWIESHQELGRHPKVRRAAKLFDVSRPAIIGHLQYLWWWALDFAQDGNITGFDDEELAEAALWDQDAGTFVQGMVTCGFIDEVDGKRILHDWEEYAGRLVGKREQAKERVRLWREKQKESKVTPPANDVTHNVPVRNATTVQHSTEHNSTVQNSTVAEAASVCDESAPIVNTAFSMLRCRNFSADLIRQAELIAADRPNAPPEVPALRRANYLQKIIVEDLTPSKAVVNAPEVVNSRATQSAVSSVFKRNKSP